MENTSGNDTDELLKLKSFLPPDQSNIPPELLKVTCSDQAPRQLASILAYLQQNSTMEFAAKFKLEELLENIGQWHPEKVFAIAAETCPDVEDSYLAYKDAVCYPLSPVVQLPVRPSLLIPGTNTLLKIRYQDVGNGQCARLLWRPLYDGSLALLMDRGKAWALVLLIGNANKNSKEQCLVQCARVIGCMPQPVECPRAQGYVMENDAYLPSVFLCPRDPVVSRVFEESPYAALFEKLYQSPEEVFFPLVCNK